VFVQVERIGFRLAKSWQASGGLPLAAGMWSAIRPMSYASPGSNPRGMKFLLEDPSFSMNTKARPR
jgi:hypothetical protein